MTAGRRHNGEGNVRLRADGSWECRITLDGGRSKSFYGKTQKEVRTKLRAAQRLQEQGLDLSAVGKWTVASWLDHWLAQAIAQREVTTRTNYETIIRRHIKPGLGKLPLSKLTAEHVEKWLTSLADKGVGVSSRQSALKRLRTALALAARRGHVMRNVASMVDMPASERTERQAPDADRLRLLLGAVQANPRMEAFVLVCLGSGLRKGEALGLQWADLDLESGRLSVRRRVNRVTRGGGLLVRTGAKTSAGERDAYAGPLVMESLRRLRATLKADRLAAGAAWRGPNDAVAPEAHVFVSRCGSVLEPRNMSRSFDRVCRHIGIKAASDGSGRRTGLDIHSLRHDFASLLGELGVPAHISMRQLGHTRPSMTLHYQHARDSAQHDAAGLVDAWLQQAVGN